MKTTKIILLLLAFLFIAHISAQETEKEKNITRQQGLNALESKIWESRSIPVCWENPATTNDTQRGWVRDAVKISWEKESKVRFTGWGKCSKESEGIRILIDDSGAKAIALGNALDGKENGIILNFDFKNWSTACQNNKESCIRSIAVHEFGHGLGFAHEHNRSDISGGLCDENPQGTNGDWYITPYDTESVMNYCSTEYNNNGNLTNWDITGVRALYGPPENLISKFGNSFAVGDFNKDGKDDLAIGSYMNEDGQGRVYIYLGTSNNGLKYWHTLDQTFLGLNEPNDHFGFALASGDFNKDGYDDLAVGIPNEKPGNQGRSGYVMIYKGTSSKLQAWDAIGQEKSGSNEDGDLFGHALAAGDFNGDGKDDLAIGVPGESPGSSPKSGDVVIFKGTNNGLNFWQGFQGQKGLGVNENGDLFGFSLAAGDFNGDGKDDLAVGSPGEAPGKSPKSGDVFIYKGSSAGLSPWLGLNGETGLGANEEGDGIGSSLTVGDFNGDGKDDLAIGVPGESPGSSPKSGDVIVYKGAIGGLTPWKSFLGQQGLDTNMKNDLMGYSVTSGDFDGDGKDDIAVGLPGKTINSQVASGNVLIYKGGSNIIPFKNLEGQKGLGYDEIEDRFGFNLISGDFNGDGKDDLAVGVPGEKVGNSRFKTGAVFLYVGTSRGSVLNTWKVIIP